MVRDRPLPSPLASKLSKLCHLSLSLLALYFEVIGDPLASVRKQRDPLPPLLFPTTVTLCETGTQCQTRILTLRQNISIPTRIPPAVF